MKMQKWITPIYLCSLMFPMTSTSWLNIWIGLEINLMMFILILMKKKSILMNESTMKYFLIQTAGSLMFLLSLSMNMTYYDEWPMIKAIVPPIALMMKMGFAPLHMWTPEVVKNFNNTSLLLFLTLQKINPVMIMYSSWFSMIFNLSIINIIVGSMSGINESSFNKLMLFSSISNSGWMIMSISISNMMFMNFMCIYTMLSMMLLMMINFLKVKWMIQLKSNNFFTKISIYLTFMSMSGLPPLLGFTPKWMILKEMIKFMPIYSWMFIMMTCLNLFFYMKYTMLVMMQTHENKKWMMCTMKNHNFIIMTMINMMGIPMFNMFI